MEDKYIIISACFFYGRDSNFKENIENEIFRRRAVEISMGGLNKLASNMRLDAMFYKDSFKRLSDVKSVVGSRNHVYENGHSYYIYKNKRLVNYGEGE